MPHPDGSILPQLVAETPWGHNLFLIEDLRYGARLAESLPPKLRGSLPSPEQIEAELKDTNLGTVQNRH